MVEECSLSIPMRATPLVSSRSVFLYLPHPVNTPRLFNKCKLGPLDVTISLVKRIINRHSKS